jgi:amidase
MQETDRLDPFASATAMLRRLRDRSWSAMELLELHLERIARLNEPLNAVVTLDEEGARQAALAADRARERGHDGALLGLPMTIKDLIDVAGMRCTGGMLEFDQRRATSDARIVARARTAGAVFMGKTNTPPGGNDCQSDNPVFGRTSNPWDFALTAGGSSGGAAAAVAAGLSALDFGSDLAGSIRVPAVFCGIYGHRPSETLLPRSGDFPGRTLPNPAAVMAVQGPLARTAEDLELALDVIAGPDAGEDVAWSVTLPPSRRERLAEFRVAVLAPVDWLPVEHEILAAQERLAAELGRAGARIAEVRPEFLGDLRDHHRLFLTLMAIVTASDDPAVRRADRERVRREGDLFADAWLAGLDADGSAFLQLLDEREAYREAFRSFFRDWDILITPANITNAFPHQEPSSRWVPPLDRRLLAIDGQPVNYALQDVYAGLSNLAGQPATGFPVGFSGDGRPVGLQALGPYLEDRTPLRFAQLASEALGGFTPPPSFR